MADKIQLKGVLKIDDVQIDPKVFKKISQSVANLPLSLKVTNAQLGKVNQSAKTLNSSLRKTTQTLNNNEKAARLFLRRMAQFAILLPTFATLNRAIQGGVKFLFEFDSALRDIVRIDISNLANRMDEIGDAAIRTATNLGVTATEVLGVTKTFKQAGFTIEESQAKAQAAILATQVSTLTASQATEIFIAAQKQFGEQGEDAISVLDRLAKVEDAAAVEASDVAAAFKTGGNALAEFAGSIDDSIGLIAALREQTRKSGSEIGTFLKTISTRIFAAGDSRTALEGLGIEVENLDGSLRPLLPVLNDLSKRFDTLTQAQQANAGKAIAGVRQVESLLATTKALSKANELSAISAGAAGTANEKKAITDAKLERQVGKLIAQGQALAASLGDAGFEETLVGALKVANGLLNSFTKLADVLGGLGGNITPLLALAGVTLGKSIFGLGGSGDQKQQQGPKAGQQGFFQSLTASQKQMRSFGSQMGRVTSILGNTAVATGKFGVGLAKGFTVSEKFGIRLNANSQAISVHTNSIRNNIAAIKRSEAAHLQNQKGVSGSSAAIVGLSLAASLVPAALKSFEERLRKSGEAGDTFAADVVGASSQAISMGTQFAVLGPQAAAVGAAFGALQTAIVTTIDAMEDEMKAREEITKQQSKQAQLTSATASLTSGTKQGAFVQGSLIRSLEQNVDGVKTGKELAAAISAGFTSFVQSEVGQANNFDGINIAEILLGDIGIFKTFIDRNKELISSISDNKDTTENYKALMDQLANATNADLGSSFQKLLQVLGAGEAEISKITGMAKRSLDFKDFQAAQKTIQLADSIRTLGLELKLAQAGPAALSDTIIKLDNELMILERASSQALLGIQDELGALFANFDDFGVGLNPLGLSATEFFKTVNDGVKELDPEKIKVFEDFIKELPNSEREAANKILSSIKNRFDIQLALENKSNDLLKERSTKTQAVLDAETKATQNALEASIKFNAELAKFGSTVDENILSVFQNVGSADVDSVLAGNSGLSGAVQDLILSAFADPLTKAENQLRNITIDTQAELDILSSKLDDVNEKLADESLAKDRAAQTSEKAAILLAMEEAKRNSLIKSTQAKIKVLEEEQKAIEEAAKEEKKRADLLDKLAKASRKLKNEIKDVEKSFEKFVSKRISDLVDDENDAKGKLQEAQKEVIDSTKSLSEAYASLITAQFAYNNAIAEAQIKSNLIARDIGALNGELVTFDQGLNSIQNSFNSVLNDANISLDKRIALERQLAEETLQFLQNARNEITGAGVGIFGQSAEENQNLGQGIDGLQFVADQLGGSFESFLNLTQGELSDVTNTLLGLPTEFRQQILNALNFLPSTTNVGGFSPDQLREAIGQVGAGVSPESGLPSIEELGNQQVEQLTKLQDLALQDAQLQISQVIAAQEAVALAEQELDAAKIAEERASEKLGEVRDAILEEKAVLEAATQEQRELLNAIAFADDRNTLMQIEKEAQFFADQNSVFREVGDNIVRGISSVIGAKLSVIEAGANVANAINGYIPNFAGGNLSPNEAAGLLRAASREKSAMPAGAGLAVANTSEAIIPMRNKGFIPNFQDGNMNSSIAAGISAARSINETVVGAISRSITQALSDLQTQDGTQDVLQAILNQISNVNDGIEDLSDTSALIQTNTLTTSVNTAGGGTTGATATAAQDINVNLQTNQNNTVTITGLENLRTELETALRDAATDQLEGEVNALLEQLDGIFTVLQERGIITSFGQTR